MRVKGRKAMTFGDSIMKKSLLTACATATLAFGLAAQVALADDVLNEAKAAVTAADGASDPMAWTDFGACGAPR